MSKQQQAEPMVGDVTAEELVKELTWKLRRNRLLHDPYPAPEARQDQLEALILSILSEREVRLTESECSIISEMKADAYLFDPKTQTLKEAI